MTTADAQKRACLVISLAEQLKRAALYLGDAATLEAANAALQLASKAKGRASKAERIANGLQSA